VEGGRQHYNVTLAALTLAGIAYALQQTMVIPALPTLQRDLHTTTTWVTWVLTVFLLVASVATPILGKLGDQYGKERILLVSLLLFLVGSIGAAAAWNIWALIAWRALQGAGAAVFPLSYGIIRDEFPREKVGVAIGLISAVFGIGGGFGIVLSGVIVDNVSWRWLFIVGAINIAAATVLVQRFVPESPIKTPSRVDFVGATLLSGGLIAMLVALTEGEDWGWTSTPTLTLAAAAAVLFVAWGIAELRVPEPMVDMRMLAVRQVLLTNLTALVAGFAMFGTFVLVAVAAASLALLHGEPWEILAAMAVLGIGVGFAFAAMATLITEAVRPSETGVATGMNTVMRTVGGVIGGQVGAALLAAHTVRGTNGVPSVTGFEIAFAISAVMALVGAALALFVTPPRFRRRERLVVATGEWAK
jgi:MFS family permease